MAMLDYQCKKNHIFEEEGPDDKRKCPKCGSVAEIIWMAPRSPHRQLSTPIVMWRYKDGSLGVAGGADSKTPKGAERIEIRSVGEYRRHVRELNSQHRGKESQREERFLEYREKMEKHMRSNLAYMMGQETDPVAKDIYREALNHQRGDRRRQAFQEYFSTAMEMDRSNYE